MNQELKIPHGEDKVKVELTLKELMVLAGTRFPNNHVIEVSARKKLNEALEQAYEIETGARDSSSIGFMN
ncbi:hypothetical protein [Paenibacillus xylaniclasticus]|uniref:hypothetical protein n=1 Tax=Paenibacillus xylaniclasticus TaxID=588083 RepID=UPI000FDC8A9A|nr:MULTISPECIES: hypothetical protein [Paenibacillus]GFN31079.1 hypothetical protein PCURB6_13390 [Paenibacillus curdlanolyticus]